MKKIFLLILMISGFCAKAQYVTIPDPNFRATLMNLYPSCFNANEEMDTTCSNIVNETNLNVSGWGINELYGIEYFDNLIFLDCSGNNLTFLPYYFGNLINLSEINFRFNQFSEIPDLDVPIETLDISYNLITKIWYFPPTLKTLNCEFNQITEITYSNVNLISLN